MRVLIVTKIFPNAADPLSSPFNRQQFAALGRLCEVEVLAAIPWFPGTRLFRRWSAAGRLTGVPDRDVIDGLPVRHPRFLFLPKVGHALTGALYTASLAPLVLRHHRRVDVVLGSWAYPDGVAAVALGALLGVPSVVKVHGTDINVVAEMAGPRLSLRLALPRAARVVAVSSPLADEVARIGVPRERIEVVPNGVDGALFHPRERAAARAMLQCNKDGRLVLYVGRLEPSKGVLDLLDAFARLAPAHPDLSLVLVGAGTAEDECRERAARIGAQVRLVGARPLAEIPVWMAASDLVTLPSWNEGSPNALLEAIACGRPVVATRVGGIPELVTGPVLGELVPPRSPEALAAALVRVAYGEHAPEPIAAAARGGWDESAAHLYDVLRAAREGAA
ncbi:MAG: glycosyltransferase family 4 protein [Myxococcales bacterium]|nr:glycosyltransferase family 4 protein [Myxococcales bacterium]